MIKEKDYPYFCKPEGKEKFERFIRDFKICAPSKLPNAAHYSFCRKQHYIGSCDAVFDHPSFWMTDEIHRKYYAVYQSYLDKNTVLERLSKDKNFRFCAFRYGYKTKIFTNEEYSWHNDNMTFILIQLNNPCRYELDESDFPVDIEVA